jgi:manganese-dependent inorganic pyrophosphatase
MDISQETVFVLGHRNPDTDAIASAVGYAWLLNQLGVGQYLGGRIGPLNPQTTFVLARFGLDLPPLISDVRPHVGDMSEKMDPLMGDTPLLAVCEQIARVGKAVPVVNANGEPLGMISGAGLFRHLVPALTGRSDLNVALDEHASRVIEPPDVLLKEDENVSDILPQVLRAEHDEFVVTDAHGCYCSMVTKSALLQPPRRRVVLVDHNELAQAVPGLEEAELVEVLDHHRLNVLPTTNPIRLQIEPVGSCSTLVAERASDEHLSFPPAIAGVLLCGILSDTLHFRSPTTTQRDRAAARWLAPMAGLSGPGLSGDMESAVAQLASELLAAGAGLRTRPGDELVTADIKYYPAGDWTIGIAQVEVTEFTELGDRKPDLEASLQKLIESQGLTLAILMVTNIVSGDSRLLMAGMPRLIGEMPYARLGDGSYDAPGVVSRKKQLLPAVLSAVSQAV